ncbi:hypothetical protein GGX14DRAFT_396690 [Mycena pura]|uniref:Uncharacterized protein n=1 Tax=Mycena pura TaxID=153505 RepID=A0AAD6VBT4_9AGAR|nr:hypothetical protein GGX14DRAFT_396690 [Mycena pura]
MAYDSLTTHLLCWLPTGPSHITQNGSSCSSEVFSSWGLPPSTPQRNRIGSYASFCQILLGKWTVHPRPQRTMDTDGDEGRQVSCDAYATKKGRGHVVFMHALFQLLAVCRKGQGHQAESPPNTAESATRSCPRPLARGPPASRSTVPYLLDQKRSNFAVAPAEDAKFTAAAAIHPAWQASTADPFVRRPRCCTAHPSSGMAYTLCCSHAPMCDACTPRAVPYPAPSRHASTALRHLPLRVQAPLGETSVLHLELDKLLAMDEPALRAPGSGSTSATEEGRRFGTMNNLDGAVADRA